MGRVFLSYARKDVRRAGKIAAAFEAAGHEVWWDSRLKGGCEYSREIDEALKSADAVVVLWSKAAVASEWVRDEASVGKQSGRLIPARIDASEPPLGFRQHHTIDLFGRGRGGMAQLIDAVGEKTLAGNKPVTVVPARERRWWMAAAAVALLLAVAAALLLRIFSPVAQRDVSLAVLPFADLSPGKDKAYFAEGVAEEILGTLAAEPGFKVLGRTSARLLERDADPKELRRRLGITHLLEGSARSSGDQLRVNVRLIDTSDGHRLWEEEYQGRPADVFAVQDRIAGAVVQRLRGTFSGAKLRKALPTNAETFQTYLAARALMRNRSQEGLQEAFTLAQRVIRGDPNYAPGHALIAELYHLLSDDFRAYGTTPLEQARRLGIPHAREAIRLAPATADGYAALGIQLEGEESLVPLSRSVELDPSRGEIRTWLGFTLNDLGRHDQALAHYLAAAEIDPLGFVPVNRLVHALAAAGQQREAVRTVRQFIARGGDALLEPTFMMQIANWQAKPSAVIAYGRKMLARERVRHQFFRLYVAAALHAVGEGKQAASLLLPMQDLHAPYFQGDLERLHSNIALAGPRLWKRADASFAFVHLAHRRDWGRLVALYDRRGISFEDFCEQRTSDAATFTMALRAEGRVREADNVLDCLRKRMGIELRNKGRLPQDWPGDLEFRHASLAALDAEQDTAMIWLERAVGRGWLGQPYSNRLEDYPQFDELRSDPRFALLQRRIDGRIAIERRALLN